MTARLTHTPPRTDIALLKLIEASVARAKEMTVAEQMSMIAMQKFSFLLGNVSHDAKKVLLVVTAAFLNGDQEAAKGHLHIVSIINDLTLADRAKLQGMVHKCLKAI